MPNPEKSDGPRPRQRFTTLLPSEHLRRTAVQAGREMDKEQADSVVSIAKVLDQINDAESRTDLQARLGLLEEQVDKLKSRRDEVDQSVESQLSVLRTTLESALEAIASLALPTPGMAPEVVDMLRTEFDEKLVAARSDLRYEIVNLEKRVAGRPDGADEMESLREDFQSRMDAADERAEKASGYLEEQIAALRQEFEEQKTRQAEVLARLSAELSGLAGALAAPASAPAEAPGPS